jgi:plasmid stabilization system protein ParE
MNRFAVVVAPSAGQQARLIAEWWRSNRLAAADLFDGELAVAPATGLKYRESKGRLVRRLLMPRTSHHVYFEIDEEKSRVDVVAVWHTARGKRPPL